MGVEEDWDDVTPAEPGGVGGENLREFALRTLKKLAQGGGRNAMAQVAACKAILDATEPPVSVTVAGWAPAAQVVQAAPSAPALPPADDPDDWQQ